MPKKRVVASCRPQLSPVKSSSASLVKIYPSLAHTCSSYTSWRHTTLHFRGDIGLWLNTRARSSQLPIMPAYTPPLVAVHQKFPTFLEYRCFVNLCHTTSVLVFLVHVARSVAPGASSFLDIEKCPAVSPPNVALANQIEEVSGPSEWATPCGGRVGE
jgi:hypothetical protein